MTYVAAPRSAYREPELQLLPPSYPAKQEEKSDSQLVRVTKIVLPIICALSALVLLPFPVGLLLGAAIAVGGLFFGGCCSCEAIRKLFSSIRPLRTSVYTVEVDRPASRGVYYSTVYGQKRASSFRNPIVPTVVVASAPSRRERAEVNPAAPASRGGFSARAQSYMQPPRERAPEREGVNQEPLGPPPPYEAPQREEVDS